MCFNEMLYAFSDALDKVEHDLLGVATHHSIRVAYMVVRMGGVFGLTSEQLSDLAACAVLHDNALTEYIKEEYGRGRDVLCKDKQDIHFGEHCVMGEKNVKDLPFFGDVTNVILYHHENANGTGPFGKKAPEVPLYAGLIHIADQLDGVFNFTSMDEEKYSSLIRFLREQEGVLYSPKYVKAFLDTFSYDELERLGGEESSQMFARVLPVYCTDYSPKQIVAFAKVFARIIDYKSKTTRMHSVGVAHRASRMAEYYGMDEERKAKFYLAGALHDVGKVFVDTDIIEKPGRLNEEEFELIKGHSSSARVLLEKVTGLEEISRWIEMHHEKLNGSGYPHGLTKDDIVFEARLLTCLDIYQALTENRPYKNAITPREAIGLLRDMAQQQLLDSGIVEDLAFVFVQGTAPVAI